MRNVDPRMIFGLLLLLVITILALIIALGKVHQETSYGLEIVLGNLATLSGGFAQWAFSKQRDDAEKRVIENVSETN